MKILFVNELSPTDKRIGAVRMRELANAAARQNHHVILFTTSSNDSDITDLKKITSLLSYHDWSTPLNIHCGRQKNFWLEMVRQKTLPKFLSKPIVAIYYLFFFGITRDWKIGSKPFWRPLATEFSPDIVIGTFGNSDGLMIAKNIAALADAPWVLDMKDSWENFIPFLFRHYIARQFQDAAFITTLADFYVRDAKKWFPKIPHQVIYSGFPAALLEKSPQTTSPKKNHQLFLVGSCYNQAYLRILLNGIAQWSQKSAIMPVELHYLGNDRDVDGLFALYIEKFSIINHGQLPFDEYVAWLKQADVLCYIHLDVTFHHKSTELLAFQKPIICVPLEHKEAVALADNANVPLYQCEQENQVVEALTASTDVQHSTPVDVTFLESLTWDAQATKLLQCVDAIPKKKKILQKNTREKFIQATLWSGLSMYFFFAFNFICQWGFSRLLTPIEIGVFAFGIAVREIIGMVCIFAMPGAYIKSDGTQFDFNAYMILTLCACGAQMVITIIVSAYYFLYVHNNQIGTVIILLGISQVLILMGYAYMATLEKKLEYKSIALFQGAANGVAGMIGLSLAYYFHTVYALIVRELLSAGLLLYWIKNKTKTPFYFQYNIKNLKEQFIFGVKCAFARMSEIGFYRIPELLISFLLSKTFLGYFYQGRYLAYFPIKLFQPFTNSVLFSFFAHHQENRVELEKQFWWINYFSIRVLIPICSVIYLFGSQFLVMMYGQKWLIAGTCFSYFSLFILAGVLFAIASNMANLINKQSDIVKAYMLGLVIFLCGIAEIRAVAFLALLFSLSAFIAVFCVTCQLFSSKKTASILLLHYPIMLFIVGFFLSHYLQFNLQHQTELAAVLLLIVYLSEYRYLSKLVKVIKFRK